MKKNKVFGVLLGGSLLLGSFGEVHSMAASVVVSAIASATPSMTATAAATATATFTESFVAGGVMGYGCAAVSYLTFWRLCCAEDDDYLDCECHCCDEEKRVADRPQRRAVAPLLPGEIPQLGVLPPLDEALRAIALLPDDEAPLPAGVPQIAEALLPDVQTN